MTLVVVAGALANKAGNGGEAWVRLSYLLGFRRLGCDVAFVEQAKGAVFTDEAGDFFEDVLGRFGLLQTATLIDETGTLLRGDGGPNLEDLAAEADLLVNISGNLRWKPALDR